MSQENPRTADVWFYGTLAYCVVIGVVAALLDMHQGGGRIMPPLVRVLFAPAMLSFGAQAIYAGELRGRWGGTTAREENPIVFWIGVGAYVIFACYLLFSGLAQSHHAPT
jgi:hypothetical protein